MDLHKHFINFLCCVSAQPGLDAFMPNCANNINFVFLLDLHQPDCYLKSKGLDLGFVTDRNILYIGKSCAKENIFIAFVHDAYSGPQYEDNPDDSDDHDRNPATCSFKGYP